MAECPLRAQHCKDVDADGTYIRRLTCFSCCVEGHELANCERREDWEYWRICKNKRSFWEARDMGHAWRPIMPGQKYPAASHPGGDFADGPTFPGPPRATLPHLPPPPVGAPPQRQVAGESTRRQEHASGLSGTSADAGRRPGPRHEPRREEMVIDDGDASPARPQTAFETYTDSRLKAMASAQEVVQGQVEGLQTAFKNLDTKVDTNQSALMSRLDQMMAMQMAAGAPPRGAQPPEQAPAPGTPTQGKGARPTSRTPRTLRSTSRTPYDRPEPVDKDHAE